jgi:peptidoglycan/LPS O-acetylase OafA/YrhL
MAYAKEEINYPAQSSHLERIDVLRACAILMVVCFHYLPTITGQQHSVWNGMWRDVHSMESPWMWFLYPVSLGWSGVSLFFVISGFCIHYSFLKHEASSAGGGGENPFLQSFFWKRFWRIYPPYFIALVVFYISTRRHHESGESAGNFLAHLLLVHNFSAGTFSGINPSFWSMAVEAQFYLLFPLVLMLRQQFGIKKTFWIFAAVSLPCRIAASFFQDWSQPPSQVLWNFTLILYVDWLLGAWLAEKWLSGQHLFGASPGKIVALGILAVALTWNKFTMGFFAFTACSVFYAMLMEWYLFSAIPIGRLGKILVPVGLCSYSIYLWHQPLVGRFQHWFHKFGIPVSSGSTVAVLPLVVLVMIILGFASYKLIEQPGISLGKRLYRK